MTIGNLVVSLAAGLILHAMAFAPATAQQMIFRAVPPPKPVEIFGNTWTIYAKGEIDDGAPERLRQLLAANNIPDRSIINLDSNGGNLLAGIKLGKVIRESGLYTYVGTENPGPQGLALAGSCYSACALAYLGGVYRWMVKDSVYGVHRFYSSGPNIDSDTAQLLSAAIVQYITEMGVDPDLFAEMSAAGGKEINVLDEAKLTALRVVNNGLGATTWTIESVPGAGIYLRGQRDTFRGVNKFLVGCPPNKKMYFYTIFDAENRGNQILSMKAISLSVDDEFIPVESLLLEVPTIAKGWLNAMFSLTPEVTSRLLRAKTVGIIFQYTHEAPTFFGFIGMESSAGSQKLSELVRLCGR